MHKTCPSHPWSLVASRFRASVIKTLVALKPPPRPLRARDLLPSQGTLAIAPTSLNRRASATPVVPLEGGRGPAHCQPPMGGEVLHRPSAILPQSGVALLAGLRCLRKQQKVDWQRALEGSPGQLAMSTWREILEGEMPRPPEWGWMPPYPLRAWHPPSSQGMCSLMLGTLPPPQGRLPLPLRIGAPLPSQGMSARPLRARTSRQPTLLTTRLRGFIQLAPKSRFEG